MADKTDALNAAKSLMITDFDPSPQEALKNVYVYPSDMSSINYSALPLAIWAEVVNQEFIWGRWGDNLTRHSWLMECSILLAEGLITDPRRGAEVEARQVDYYLAMANFLTANQRLNETVELIGADEMPPLLGEGDANAGLFRYQTGYIEAFNTKVYWGPRFFIPVIQAHVHTIGY